MISYFKFSEQNQYDLDTIHRFNDEFFPQRKPHKEYDVYRFLDNPFSAEKLDYLYGVEKAGEYVAQMLTMPSALTLNEKQIPVFWGQDYFVKESSRGEGIGKELANYYLSNDYYIAVGFSPKSAIIHQKMGARKIGYLDLYTKWASPFHRFKFLLERGMKRKPKHVSAYEFPEKTMGFTRIHSSSELHLPELSWNENVIASIRTKEYFQWRFFYKSNRYFVYQNIIDQQENAIYFVAKPYFYKGVNWLKVIDYRFNLNDPSQFEKILKGINAICKELNLYGLMLPSSQKITENVLLRKGFLRQKHQVVLTTFPFDFEEIEESHDQFVISFADSDQDMHNYLGKFNYG